MNLKKCNVSLFMLAYIFFGVIGMTYALDVPLVEHPDPDTYGNIVSTYSQLIKRLVPENSQLKVLYNQPLLREKIDLDDEILDSPDGKIWLASLHQPLTLTFYHVPLKLRSVHNYALEKYLLEHKDQTQKIPTLTFDQAIAKARDYLKIIDFTLPPNYRLDKFDFNVSNPSIWTIRWQRYAGDFAYDNTNQLLSNYASISFHETLGIGNCAIQSFLPDPSSLVVKVTSEEALLKASKVVPLIENTPYYQKGRVSGFVVKSLKEASLRVVVPNWLLDPHRATWIHSKIPDEVRLCWVIRFTTVNSRPEPDPKYSLVPPEIIVYVDASTGEIVGGTFT